MRRSLVAVAVAAALAWPGGLDRSGGRARADGVHAVGRVRPIGPGPTLSLALLSGYGYTEDALDDGATHHRASGAVSLALRPIRWLELGGQLAGRYDRHGGGDDGLIGDPRLWATAGGAIGGGASLGAQLVVWLPGADAPSVELDATTVDASAVLTYAPGATALTVRAGYRLDRSARSIDATRLSPGDRLALGVADTDSVLAGAGVAHRVGAWQVLGEASGELLIDATRKSVSPWRVGAGVRRALDRAFTLEAMLEVSGSARQDPMAVMDGELVPVEPRLAIGLGLSWRPAPARARAVVVTPPDDVVIAPPPPPPPPAPTVGPIRGRVTDETGEPLVGAEVTAGDRTVEAGKDGVFVVPDVAAGDVTLVVIHPGHENGERTVAVIAGAGVDVEIALTRIKPPSQIRGLIRGFDGKGLAAKVRIEPLGVEVTAGADGTFSVDAPPGSYTVVIEHAGHDTQRRPVKLEEDEVESLNVELRKRRR